MQLKVPDDLAAAAIALSKGTGTTPEQILLKALRAHFPPVSRALREEFEAWARAAEADAAALDLGELPS